ncbi:MAG: hypothetical protein ABI443_11045 [Chthoniobacterales bacterium]
MFDEPVDFHEMLKARKDSAAETIHEISIDDVRALVDKLFPDVSHPWHEICNKFIDEHKAERILQGETSDGVGFIYCPNVNRGIWYEFVGKARGVGIISERSLAALKEITSAV